MVAVVFAPYDDHVRWACPPCRKMWDNEWNMTLLGLAEHAGKEGWSADGKVRRA
jgi:hypothetical protein